MIVVMFRAINKKLHRMSAHKNALWVLALVAFLESSVWPIPPDILLIPMIIAARSQAWKLAGICTLMSVLGGFLAYVIGALFYDYLGQNIITLYDLNDDFIQFTKKYNEMGPWIVGFFGLTPLPYKLVGIASGITDLNPFVFGASSLLSRGLRFFLIAAIIWYFGPLLQNFIERYFGWIIILFCALVIASFYLLKLF